MSKAKQILHLLTPEGKALQSSPATIPWDTYPRPQMKRDSFLCLNGKWEITVDGDAPRSILVPFCPESILSGVGMEPKESVTLTYRKKFSLPEGFPRVGPFSTSVQWIR